MIVIGFRCEQSARFYVKNEMANGNDRLVFSRKYLASSYANIEIFMSFDPIAATESAKKTRALRKGKNYKKRTSKLEPFRSEIAKMYKTGASLELISLHLRIPIYLNIHSGFI